MTWLHRKLDNVPKGRGQKGKHERAEGQVHIADHAVGAHEEGEEICHEDKPDGDGPQHVGDEEERASV